MNVVGGTCDQKRHVVWLLISVYFDHKHLINRSINRVPTHLDNVKLANIPMLGAKT